MNIKRAFFILYHGSAEGRHKYLEAVRTVEDIINRQNVEIDKLTANKEVRCKDCTEWDEAEGECRYWYGFKENDYCSHGTRKEQK